MSSIPYNARYAKPRIFIRDWKLNRTQLLCGNGSEGASRCNLLDIGLVITKQMKQESCGNACLGSKCSETATYAHFAVDDIHDTHRSSYTNQNITRLCQFGWRTGLDRRDSKRQFPKENLSLMELNAIGFIQGLTDGGLPHV